jgi:hypothetical protein
VQKFFRESRETLEKLWPVVEAIGKALMAVFNPRNTQAMADVLVKIVIPAITDVINVLGELLYWFHLVLGNEFVSQVAKFLLTAALLGKGLQMISNAFKAVFMMNPWILAIGAIILILYKLETRFHFIERTVKWLKNAWNTDWGSIRTTLEKFWKWLQEVFWPSVVKGAKQTWEDINKYFVKPMLEAWGLIKTVFMKAWKDIKEELGLIGTQFRNFFKLIDDLVHGKWGKVWGDLKNIMVTELKLILNGFDIFVNSLAGAWNWLVGKLKILPDSWKIDGRVNFSGALDGADSKGTGKGNTPVGIRSHADGGLANATPGGIYRVAEAGHDEMIIPLDPSKRGRATDLLRMTMARMGMIPNFALGGIFGGVEGVAKGALGKLARATIGPAFQAILKRLLPLVLSAGSVLHTGAASVGSIVKEGLHGIVPGFADGGIPGFAQPGKSHTWLTQLQEMMKRATQNGMFGLGMDEFKNYLFSKPIFNNPLMPYSVARTDHGLGNMSWGLPTKAQTLKAAGATQNFTIHTTQPDVDVDYVMRRAQQHMMGGT